MLAATGASKVALVGISRGGYPIRNFIANGGGAALVSHAVLGGVPNHGVWATRRSFRQRVQRRRAVPDASSTRRRAPTATKSRPASPG